jgi:hypothetical protein
MIFPWIWELLPRIHFSLFWISSTSEWSDKKGQEIWMDYQLPKSIWHYKEMIHGRTSFIDARPIKTIPNRVWHIKSGNWGSTYPTGFKWQLTSHCILVKDFLWNWKKVQNLCSRITRYYLSAEGVETLHPRIRIHDNCLFWPQEFDILLNSTEVK